MLESNINQGRRVYTVSQLNMEANAVLGSSFPLLWIEGELSNLARPASGHLYFTLKDAQAQVRCAMFRQHGTRLNFRPQEGMQVLLRARIGLYERRGDFQLVVEHMEESGSGRLQLEFERLKNRLNDEGLFEASRKLPIPVYPRRLGIITSPSGAALQDILNVLRRRYPVLPVIIYPTAVQGESAAKNIIQMLRVAQANHQCDVLILARGGGSLEDLWPFNDETLARALFDCKIPVVTGIGHEIDYTIADFVADMRAPTPSAAAELVTPNKDDLRQQVEKYRITIENIMDQLLESSSRSLSWLRGRLNQQRPSTRLQQGVQRLDEMEMRLGQVIKHLIDRHILRLGYAASRLKRQNPAVRIQSANSQLQQLSIRLHDAGRRKVQNRMEYLQAIERALLLVSPLATLDRGYAIVTREPHRAVVRRSSEVSSGDTVAIRLASGALTAKVEKTHK